MANPNRTVAAARTTRRFVMVDEKPFGVDRVGAEQYRDQCKADGKDARLSSYKLGPRRKPSVQCIVRLYERA